MSNAVYKIITDRMLELMDKGVAPWRKAWKGGDIRPMNAETCRPYNGGNVFWLSALGFATPAFLTFNQIKKAGARLKAGKEKNHFPVLYWKMLETEDDNGKKSMIPFPRYFRVWNIEDVEGYELPKKLQEMIGNAEFEHDLIQAAEEIVAGYQNPPEINSVLSGKAFYRPSTDTVTVPELGQFEDASEYYSTLFHELGHSTGHKSRLSRKEVVNPTLFGDHDYSLEELVAELTAAFLCSEAGVDNSLTVENSAAYLKGWHSKLSDDPKLFWTAASRAQKAADHIMGR